MSSEGIIPKFLVEDHVTTQLKEKYNREPTDTELTLAIEIYWHKQKIDKLKNRMEMGAHVIGISIKSLTELRDAWENPF